MATSLAPAAGRKPGLDVVRSAAILLVMAHHFRHAPGVPPAFEWAALRGFAGVDLFFVLSGWLIGGQLMREVSRTGTVELGRFWARRWFRTLPAYLAVLAAMVAWGRVPVRQLPAFLTFAQNYLAPGTWLVTWSLCIEEHFYLLLPLTLLAVARLPRGARPWAVLAALALSPALRALAYPRMAQGTYAGFLEDFYGPTHLRLDGLLVGVLAAGLRERLPAAWGRLEARAHLLALVGVAVFVGATWLPWLSGWTASGTDRMAFFPAVPGFTVAALGAALLLPLAARDVPRLHLGWAPFVWISEHAYALYLTHEQAAGLADRLLPGRGFWVHLAASTALSLAVAAALRALVEQPGLHLRDRWIAGRATAALTSPRSTRP